MSKWEAIALGVGLYALGAAGAVVYLVTRGTQTGSTFDGFTTRETEGGKAAEAILFWPAALAVTLIRSKQA